MATMLKPNNKAELEVGAKIAGTFGFTDGLDAAFAAKAAPRIASGQMWSVDYGQKVENTAELRSGRSFGG